jgi:hypothetical protein
MTTSTTRKQPQDRRPKATDEGTREMPDDVFKWTDADGTEWVSDVPIREVVTPGLVRRNRHNDMTLVMEALELLFAKQPEFFDVIDVSWEQTNAAGDAFLTAVQDMGTSMGESGRSSS